MKLQKRGMHRINDVLNNRSLGIDEKRDRTHESRQSVDKLRGTLS
jgi:hypothetical protein